MMKHKQLDGLKVSSILLVASGLLIFIISGLMWHNYVYMGDRRIFWDALNNALSSQGVRKTIDLGSGGDIQKQVIDFVFSPSIQSRGVVTIKNADSEAISEVLVFDNEDYARYVTLTNPEPSALSEIVGQWAQTRSSRDIDSQSLGQQLANGPLVLVGNFNAQKRAELVDTIQSTNAYQLIGKSGTVTVNGKNLIVFKVQIEPNAYNVVLAKYVSMLGLSDTAAQISGSVSASSSTLPVIEIAIDPVARDVVQAGYPSIGQMGTETYELWGVAAKLQKPDSYLTIEQMQEKLNAIYAE